MFCFHMGLPHDLLKSKVQSGIRCCIKNGFCRGGAYYPSMVSTPLCFAAASAAPPTGSLMQGHCMRGAWSTLGKHQSGEAASALPANHDRGSGTRMLLRLLLPSESVGSGWPGGPG